MGLASCISYIYSKRQSSP